ncbi:long-chain fatty acid--CoA ligase [Herbiconiux sp. L3-i23]|uniref:AMP-dependent synthetase/ligase n=1 Tax=Herbiconiux sp. L3-i23 TaxID=2905871 RepID=UPI00205CA612|nr:long-chain fatty acid--CoA ligase [Herbiconiux sp. L3-i23]BDI22385.1 long-chain-fatty-acid--CoA ligase [Herbiconiux sp. L3-i23]
MKQIDAPAVTQATPDDNATDLLLERVAATPDAPLFALQRGDEWVDVTARDFLDQVRALAKGFIAAGVEPGDRIGLMAKTRYEWTLIDFAAWFAGAILVPVYETSSPHQILWNLNDGGATAVIVEGPEHFAKFDEVHPDLPAVRNVWQIERGDLTKLVAGGAEVTDELLEERRSRAVESDIATIIYTSGTTGRPKGCVLTHANFVELCRNTQAAIPELIQPGQSTLLFIPTAHIFARFIAVLCTFGGVKVGHQPDTTKLVPSLGSFRPTFLLAVPRVFEKVYNSAEQKAEAGGKGKIFRRAADVAIAHSKALDAGHVPFGLKVQFALFDRLVYSKLKTTLGGRVRFAVSGSAPLGTRLGHFYRSLGIMILEGYGLTETTAPMTVNRPSKYKIGTVGPALPGVSIRIADDGEIETKGVNLFSEYWQNEEATAEAFNDGWFKTGDIGEFDSDGYLRITGRKKELIVTAGGKNVSPAALEDPLRANPVVGQVVVVGDQKPFISALITLDTEMLPTWLKNNGHDETMSLEQASRDEAVLAEVQRAVDHANSHVSRAESIRKFVIIPVEFTEASGHLTPKLSIKRNVILTDFAEVIEGIYSPDAPTKTEGISLVH